MKHKIIGTFKGKCCDSQVYNNNGMFLNRDLFNILINSEEYKRAMQYRHYIGFLGHPEDPNCMDFEHACIIMTSMEMLENGEIWGTFDLVDTPVGQIVKAFIDAGVIFGISIRGAGDLDNNGKVDPETFIFRGFDLVTFPAYDDAIPEFHEIAASTDIQKQAKYKKICATIQINLPKIQSCEALEIIQSQFDNSSNEFQLIGDRINELECIPESTSCEDDTSILNQKLDAVTTLYLQMIEENRKLVDENNSLKLNCTRITSTSDRKIRTLDRITSAQMADMESALTTAENKYLTVVSANTRLKDQNQEYISACSELEDRLRAVQNEMRSLRKENRRLDSICSSTEIQAAKELKTIEATSARLQSELEQAKKDNLIYQRKIESTTQIVAAQKETISEYERKIDDLKSKLRETVTASQKLDQQSSNRDAEIEALRKKLVAAQQLIGDYQQAYANMCANAIGIDVDNIPITGNTTPSQLKSYIFGSTTTSGLNADPTFAEPEQIERVDDGEYFGGDELVSL